MTFLLKTRARFRKEFTHHHSGLALKGEKTINMSDNLQPSLNWTPDMPRILSIPLLDISICHSHLLASNCWKLKRTFLWLEKNGWLLFLASFFYASRDMRKSYCMWHMPFCCLMPFVNFVISRHDKILTQGLFLWNLRCQKIRHFHIPCVRLFSVPCQLLSSGVLGQTFAFKINFTRWFLQISKKSRFPRQTTGWQKEYATSKLRQNYTFLPKKILLVTFRHGR